MCSGEFEQQAKEDACKLSGLGRGGIRKSSLGLDDPVRRRYGGTSERAWSEDENLRTPGKPRDLPGVRREQTLQAILRPPSVHHTPAPTFLNIIFKI